MEMMETSIGIWMLLLRRLVPKRARSLPESLERGDRGLGKSTENPNMSVRQQMLRALYQEAMCRQDFLELDRAG